jgi:hypothetical protein
MAATKRTTLQLNSPLDNTGILLQILNILGPGHHLFVSAVSKAWREGYKRVDEVQMNGLNMYCDGESELHTITSQTTLCSSVFSSAASLTLGLQHGLAFENDNIQRLAGRFADVSTLRVAHELGLPLSYHVVIGAAESGCTLKLQWLHIDKSCELPRSICNYTARTGSIRMLWWLQQHGKAFTIVACMAAAAGAHLHVLRYLRDERCEFGNEVCSAAASHGHLSILQWLHEQGCPWNADEICGDAAESGSIEILLYLRQQGCEYSADTMEGAARSGQLAVCRFLVAEQCPCDDNACATAAMRGHLEIVRFLHESGCPWDATTICARAVRSSSIELLEYLKQQGCVFSGEAMELAAAAGDLQLVRYLHENGCTWDRAVITKALVIWGAAAVSNLQLLQFLRQQGCAFSVDIMRIAARRGHLHICQYLRAEQCPWDAMACDNAAHSGHVHTLRWLHEQGCPWSTRAIRVTAARAGHIAVIKYMVEVEPAVSAAHLTEMLKAAGAWNKLAAAQWLRQQGARWPTVLRFDKRPWQPSVLRWARDEGCTSPV